MTNAGSESNDGSKTLQFRCLQQYCEDSYTTDNPG